VTSRRRELAVRAALGASRGRVVRYLMAESAVLAIGAASLGVLLARTGVRLLRDFGSAYFPRTHEIALDGPVFWLLVGLTAASALLFGMVPAVYGTGGPVDESLRSIGRFLDRQCQREAASADPGGQPVCHCHAAAGRGGPAAREPEATGARRSRVRYAQRPQRVDLAAGDAVRHRRAESSRSGISCSGGSRRCRVSRASRSPTAGRRTAPATSTTSIWRTFRRQPGSRSR
jgi:hypothetical protein